MNSPITPQQVAAADDMAQHGMTAVVSNLRVINAEQRVEIQALKLVIDEQRSEYASLRADLSGAHADIAGLRGLLHEQQRLTSALQDRIDKLTGRNFKRLAGMSYATLEVADGLSLVIEGEYDPEILPTRDEPGEEALCEAGDVLIQGVWVHIPDLIQRLTDKRALCAAFEKQGVQP